MGAGLASMEAADAPLQAGVAVVCFWSVKIQIQMGAPRHRSASSCLRLGAHIQCRHRNLQMSLWDLRGWGGWFFKQMVKVHPIFQFEHIASLKSSGGRFFQKGSCSALHLDVSWFFSSCRQFCHEWESKVTVRSVAWMSFETHLDCYRNTLRRFRLTMPTS